MKQPTSTLAHFAANFGLLAVSIAVFVAALTVLLIVFIGLPVWVAELVVWSGYELGEMTGMAVITAVVGLEVLLVLAAGLTWLHRQ